ATSSVRRTRCPNRARRHPGTCGRTICSICSRPCSAGSPIRRSPSRAVASAGRPRSRSCAKPTGPTPADRLRCEAWKLTARRSVLPWWHMGSSNRPHHRYTYAQYAALERESSTKHEFFDGEIYAMAGGTEDHAALAVSTLAALLAAVGDRPCRVSSSDLRTYVEAVGLATFPDGSVICGPMQQHPPSPDATAVNPLVL